MEQTDVRTALMELYTALQGPSWDKNQGWGSDAHYCQWSFLACDSDSELRSIAMLLDRFAGTVPDVFGAFSSVHMFMIGLGLDDSRKITGACDCFIWVQQ